MDMIDAQTGNPVTVLKKIWKTFKHRLTIFFNIYSTAK